MSSSKSGKRITNDEQYAVSENWLKEASDIMEHPLCQPDERDRLYAIFKRTSEHMADYQVAKDCRDDLTRSRYIAQGITTQEWLDEYWSEIDGTQPSPPQSTQPEPTTELPPPTPEAPKSSAWDFMDDDE
jgi:hypothetical protein